MLDTTYLGFGGKKDTKLKNIRIIEGGKELFEMMEKVLLQHHYFMTVNRHDLSCRTGKILSFWNLKFQALKKAPN